MSRSHHRARFLVVALTALLTGTFAGATDLVLCIGMNGHRALELEHPAVECPTLASQGVASGISARPPAECLDLPATGAGSPTLSSADPDRVPTPPLAFRIASPEPVPPIQTRLASPIGARAGPSHLCQHLRSTVLLV